MTPEQIERIEKLIKAGNVINIPTKNDEAREKGREFTKGVLDVLGFLFLLVICLGWLLGSLIQPIDDSDFGKFNRSGLKIHTDAKTGIQYLSTPNGGLIERGNDE